MATRYAVANSTDWGDTASWSATVGGAGGASVPVTADTVYITVPVNFTVRVTQTAVNLFALFITAGFTSGTIGTSGTPLRIGVNSNPITSKMTFSGAGTLYLYAGTDAIVRYFMSGTPGKSYLVGGTFGFVLTGQSGIVTINGASVGVVIGCGMGIVIAAGSAVTNSLLVYGGSVSCAVDVPTVSVYGGICKFTGDGVNISVAANCYGGELRLNNSGGITDGSNGSNLTVFPSGKVSSTGSNVPITVDSTTLYVGGKLFEDGSVTITYTFPIGYFGFNY